MSGMTTTEVVEGIARKLWWGWVPHWKTKPRRWIIPFEFRSEPLTEEEHQWFRSN